MIWTTLNLNELRISFLRPYMFTRVHSLCRLQSHYLAPQRPPTAICLYISNYIIYGYRPYILRCRFNSVIVFQKYNVRSCGPGRFCFKFRAFCYVIILDMLLVKENKMIGFSSRHSRYMYHLGCHIKVCNVKYCCLPKSACIYYDLKYSTTSDIEQGWMIYCMAYL